MPLEIRCSDNLNVYQKTQDYRFSENGYYQIKPFYILAIY